MLVFWTYTSIMNFYLSLSREKMTVQDGSVMWLNPREEIKHVLFSRCEKPITFRVYIAMCVIAVYNGHIFPVKWLTSHHWLDKKGGKPKGMFAKVNLALRTTFTFLLSSDCRRRVLGR